MRIRFHRQMLEERKWFSFLDVLMEFLEISRHGFDPLQLEELIRSDWLTMRPAADKDLIRTAALKRSTDRYIDGSTLFINPEIRRDIIFDRENKMTTSGPIDALFLLSTPLQIVVENEFNDGAFLLWAAKAVGLEKFIKAYRNGFFAFRHAGGKHLVGRCAQSFSSGIWQRKVGGSVRDLSMFVTAMIDSDSRFFGDCPNTEIMEELSHQVIYGYCLKKRAIENYLPAEFIERKFKSSQGILLKCKALAALSKEQKMYYDMKSGLKFLTKAEFMNSPEVSNSAKNLYSNINEQSWSILAGGFGKNLSDIFSDENSRPAWNDSRFAEGDDRDELKSVISSADVVGPLKIVKQGPVLKSYVVDGHQRLATLLGVLRLPENAPRETLDDWRWWIAYDLFEERFLHIKPNIRTIPLHMLPLRNILRTVEFARKAREIVSSPTFTEEEATMLVDRADVVQRAIRDYKVPLTLMKSGSLDDAVTIFARVNQRGKDMTADQMVSALTFRDKTEGNFDLSGSIDIILGMMREYKFGDIERKSVLQIIIAIAGLDFTRVNYDRLVDRSSYEMLSPAVDRAIRATGKAVGLLRERVGLKSGRLLPYASQIVLLSIFYDAVKNDRMIARCEPVLEKWFWATSFNGWFAGANTTEIRNASERMRNFAKGDPRNDFEAFFVDRPLRPFPMTFDRRSARIRASLLVQILEGKPIGPHDGMELDGFEIFDNSNSRDIPYFFPNLRRPAISHPANRVILPLGYPRSARSVFASLDWNTDAHILESHFINRFSFESLKRDNYRDFIDERQRTIFDAENLFLSRFDLSFDTTLEQGFDDNDANDDF